MYNLLQRVRGEYMTYTSKDQAKIGVYVLEHGNKKVRLCFLAHIKNTVSNFKLPHIRRSA